MKEYCAVIRTLGKAGERYKSLLDSLKDQSYPPKKILVYIPYGYELPHETIGIEQYIRCDKGMITQRSLPFTEVDTDYILFLDDDVSFGKDFVKNLFYDIDFLRADCVIPNIYNHQQTSFAQRIFGYFHSAQRRHYDQRFNIKICLDGGFSYLYHRTERCVPTQSGAGACCLVRKSVYEHIHFEDERWMEQFSFAYGDDQMFFYKMYLYGYKLYSIFDTGIVHLDARTAVRPDVSKKMLYQKQIAYIIWHRSIYSCSKHGHWLCVCAFFWRVIMSLLFAPAEALFYRRINFLWDGLKGYYKGYKYTKTLEYKKLPPFLQ